MTEEKNHTPNEETTIEISPSVEDFLKSLKADLQPIATPFAPQTETPLTQSLMQNYAENYQKRAPLEGQFLRVLKGLKGKDQMALTEEQRFQFSLKRFLLPHNWQKNSGGFFVRWNGKGIVINPGPSFLENFHAMGYFVRDIDFVILTGDTQESYWDLQALYELNYEQNKLEKELHVVHYYVPQVAFQAVASLIRPHFKQERQSLHPMEFYLDSFESETIALDDAIQLAYFPEGEKRELGIRLDLAGDLSLSWTANYTGTLHVMHKSCHLIFAAIDGNGMSEARAVQDASNGCQGLLLLSDCTDREEDRSFETTKQVRSLMSSASYQAVLPAEMGLCITLPELAITCSTCGIPSHASHIITAKTARHKLDFICEQCRF